MGKMNNVRVERQGTREQNAKETFGRVDKSSCPKRRVATVIGQRIGLCALESCMKWREGER